MHSVPPYYGPSSQLSQDRTEGILLHCVVTCFKQSSAEPVGHYIILEHG